jgi:hypothetical protein
MFCDSLKLPRKNSQRCKAACLSRISGSGYLSGMKKYGERRLPMSFDDFFIGVAVATMLLVVTTKESILNGYKGYKRKFQL